VSGHDGNVSKVVAVVLARGLGRRMRQGADDARPRLTHEQEAAAAAGLKAMMPIGSGGGATGRPFLDYGLAALADAGIRAVALVVGPDHDALRRYYAGSHAPSRLAVSFVVQREALGTADAVRSAESFAAGRPFIVVNGDNLYPVDALRALASADGPALPVFERDELVSSSRIPSERVAAFALVKVAADGTLVDIIEKPGAAAMAAAGSRALVSMNCWKFDERIFAACRDVQPSLRGELELPDAVRLAMTRGVRFLAIPAHGPVLDLSRREDVPAVEALLTGREVRL
jgi:dTDP-glucose pyrophosphorylase